MLSAGFQIAFRIPCSIHLSYAREGGFGVLECDCERCDQPTFSDFTTGSSPGPRGRCPGVVAGLRIPISVPPGPVHHCGFQVRVAHQIRQAVHLNDSGSAQP